MNNFTNSVKPVDRITILFLLFLCFATSQVKSQTIYVDSSVSVSGNGSSWVNAYKELRDALLTIRTNTTITTINIAKGTYKPTDVVNYDSSFCLYRSNIKLYGGFPSGGGDKNIANNPVILSGATGSFVSWHVFVIAGLSSSADSIILDGITFTKGSAGSGSSYFTYNNQLIDGNKGAGLCIQGNDSSNKIKIANCTFIGNTGNTGGGIYCYNAGSVFINDCLFDSNSGLGGPSSGINSYGTGVYTSKTVSVLDNCLFKNNTCNRSGTGLALYNENANTSITNSSFISNKGPINGAAIGNTFNGVMNISNCTFKDNFAQASFLYLGFGGAIYNVSASLNINQSTFIKNMAEDGGAVYLETSPNVNLTNTNFISNTATFNYGGGISNKSSSPVITNCAFVNGHATSGGGMNNVGGSQPNVTNCTFFRNYCESFGSFGAAVNCSDSSGGTYSNCIFWKDTVETEYAPFGRYEFYSNNNGSNPSKPSPSIKYSIIQSSFPILNVVDSGHNSYDDPLFADTVLANIAGADSLFGTADDGLILQACSPGIDAGLNESLPVGTIADIKNEDRIVNNTVDIGCYENESPVVNAATLIANAGDSIYKSVYGPLQVFKDCRLITSIAPSGGHPLNGGTKFKVVIDTAIDDPTKPYVQRYYEIEPAVNATVSTATISLYFTQQEFDQYNLIRGDYPALPVNAADEMNSKANIVVHQFHGTTNSASELLIIPTSVYWDNNNAWWVVTFNVEGFSRFYINTSLNALPLVLNYFKGEQGTYGTTLQWKINCEHSSSFDMRLERSENGSIFLPVYTSSVADQQCRNPFSFTDNLSFKNSIYYRLKLTERNGKIIYSNILSFNVNSKDMSVNPSIIPKGQLLNVSVPQNNYSIVFYNSSGALIKAQKLMQGTNRLSVNNIDGICFYKVVNVKGEIRKSGKLFFK